MKDIECPYCEHYQDIDHDDGYGYREDETHQQQCENCEKYFTYTTSIHYYYDVQQADCLNGGEHNYKSRMTFPREFTMMCCTMCDDQRKPTKEEFEKILQEDKEKYGSNK